jgi:cellulose synthase/poly-beta-1,6-N-acetylglucosamine synthase-like glycosyltransferase
MDSICVYFRMNGHAVIHYLIAAAGILLLVYALLIFYYHRSWDQIPQLSESLKDTMPTIKVSVIIPARNEALHIGKCLDSLLAQTYPKECMEIVVVNDFSTDNTATLVAEHPLHCKLINLSDHISGFINSYKKKAIETGIDHSSGELIICTDADCNMGRDWIRALVNAYQKEDLQFIAAPVKIISNGSWLSIFQILDFISLQGITGAAVYKKLYPMCNGANLAYTRKAFHAVDGFLDINHIASGDDMLLMKKIQSEYPDKIHYLKDTVAIVNTVPAENIKAFLNQRIRWASKISHYKHPATFITLALVYLTNLSLLLLFIICIFYGHWRWLLLLIAFKTISEYFFVSRVAGFFQQQFLMKYFPLCQPFHILYTVIAGGFGSFGKYQWKNRKVK